MKTTIKEAAENYEPKKTPNIADLESFDISEPIEERKGKDKDGKEFTYNVLVRDEEEYRFPNIVLKRLKGILEANAKHGKEITTFSVEKTGEGKATDYQIVSLE